MAGRVSFCMTTLSARMHTPSRARSVINFAAAGSLALAGLNLAGCNNDVTDADLERRIISLPDVRKELAGKSPPLLIDARSRQDFAIEHISGAVNMGVTSVSGIKGDTDARLLAYPMLIVYGQDPASAGARALGKRMLATGYDDVQFFAGGLSAWKQAGLPTNKPAEKAGEKAPAGSVGQ
jgi:rhodanese-related sulfurtransferase